jgi:hypothetical protein
MVHTAMNKEYQANARGLADILRWWREEIVIPTDVPNSAKSTTMYDLEDVETACRRVAESDDEASLEVALQALVSRGDAARRLVRMLHDFTPRLTGDMAELVAEMERLLNPLVEFSETTTGRAAEGVTHTEGVSMDLPRLRGHPAKHEGSSEAATRKKKTDKTIVSLKIGGVLVALGLITYTHVLTALGAFVVLASLSVQFVSWLAMRRATRSPQGQTLESRAGEVSEGEPHHPHSSDGPTMQVRALKDKLQAPIEKGQKPMVGELLNLRREANSLAKDPSLSVADHFALWKLSDAIDDTLDNFIATNLPESPELKQLRQDRARYKEAFSPEFSMLMERFLDSGSAEDTKALGDLLFPKEHRARLLFILDYANDFEKTTYGELFADWVRLKGYSPSDVKELVDADVVKGLEVSARIQS